MREVKPWPEYWMELAWKASERSKDPSTQVGCVIVNQENNIVSTGYNGLPPGFPDTPEIWDDRPKKYEHVIHAEVNAVARAAGYGRATGGSFVFVTHHPCLNCAKTLIAAGVDKVFYDTVVERFPEEEMQKAKAIMEASGVEVIEL